MTGTKYYTTYEASASTTFATEGAGKVGRCTCISLIRSLRAYAVKNKAAARYKTRLTLRVMYYTEELPT